MADKTSNNKLELTARSLELIYTVPDWPPGAPALPVSLKESGKSRADLWQFAGNVGLENAISNTNHHCRLGGGNTEGFTSEVMPHFLTTYSWSKKDIPTYNISPM